MARRTIQPVMSSANLNFMYGCRRVSPGCDHCYIERYWKYFRDRMATVGATNPFEGKIFFFNERERLRMLNSLPHNSVVFVNGLSDTFGEFVTDEQRDRWLGYLAERPHLQFQLCTKRTGAMAHYFSTREVPSNVWVGTTMEDRKRVELRLPILKSIDAKIRWISFEPLLEDLGEFDLRGIQYAACGGETDIYKRYRPFNLEWAKHIYNIAMRDGCAFWYIGANGTNDSRPGDTTRGTIAQEWPVFDRCKCSECQKAEYGRIEDWILGPLAS